MIFNLEEYVKKQLLIAGCLDIGHILCGYSMGWTAPMIPKLQDYEKTPLLDIISVTQATWVGSTFNVGAIIGPIVSGYLSNIIGRKPCLIMSSSLNIVGLILLTFSVNIPMIFVGRFITGFALAMILVLNIVYFGEITTPNLRGILFTTTGFIHIFGSLMVYTIGPFVSYAVVGYVGIGISVLHTLSLFYIPESPLFYLLKGDEESAKNVLIKLGRGNNVEKDLTMLVENSEDIKEKNIKWKELYAIKSNRKSFFITIPLFILQFFCGIMAVAYFLTTILENAGSSVEPAIATIIVGVTQFISAMLVPFLIERAGRKTLLLLSTAGCCISMTVMGVYFYLDKIANPSIAYMGCLPLVIMIVLFISYGIGLNIIPNSILGEMFRPNVRSIGSSISMTTGVAMGFVSVTTFGYLVEAVGKDFTFWIFAVTNAIGFVFILTFVPETKGMSLVEIEKMLAK